MYTRLRKLGGRCRAAAAVTLALAILAALLLGLEAVGLAQPGPADPWPAAAEPGAGAWLEVRPSYASKALRMKGGRAYCLLFWYDGAGDLVCCLARGRGLDDALSELQYYTYGMREEPPRRQIVLRGVTAAAPADLLAAAGEEYALLVDDPPDAAQPVSAWMLDIDRAPFDWPALLISAALLAPLFIAAAVTGAGRRRIVRQNRRTRTALPAAALAEAERQLAGAQVWPHSGLALGADFLYSRRTGLVLADRRQVAQAAVYTGMDHDAPAGLAANRLALVLDLLDPRALTGKLPHWPARPDIRDELEEVAARLNAEAGQNAPLWDGYSAAQPAAYALPAPAPAYTAFGTASPAAYAAPAPVQPAAYAATAPAPVQPAATADALPPDALRAHTVNAGADAAEPYFARGMAAALLGCAAGGAAWVLLSHYTGFFTAWMGALVVWLALWAHRRAAGGLTRAGAIGTLALAVLTVPAAVLLSAADRFAQQWPVSFGEALRLLWPSAFLEGELLIPLCVGVAAVLAVGLAMCRAPLRPPMPPQPQPSEDGFITLLPCRHKAKRIAGFGALTAAAMFLMVVMLAQGVQTGALVMAALGLLPLIGIAREMRPERTQRITYSERGLSWADERARSHSCAWSAVTAADLDRGSRLVIYTTQGNLYFSHDWPGWVRLCLAVRQYAPQARRAQRRATRK